MVEFFVYVFERNSLPTAGVVAGLASLRSKASFVRVGMAVAAFSERQPHIPRLVVGTRRVAFLACNLGMKASERVLSFVVIKLRDILAVFEVVALLAVLAEPPIVLILVARDAGLRKSEKSSASVSHLNAHSLQGSYALGRVAAIALQASMFALQRISRLAVIEAGRRGSPFHEREAFAVVLRVTLRAFLTRVGVQPIRSMKSAMIVYA